MTQIFSLLTFENAQKALVLLPEALESFANATPDVQAEGFGKFFGMILAPLGIGSKVVQAGKAISIVGMTGMKAGAKTAERAAKIVSRQYERVSGPSERALNVAKKAGMAGVAAMSLGTGEVALAGTAIAGGTAVQYIGEMGAGKKGRISEKALADMTQAEKITKAEARSGVSRETVLHNSALPETDRFKLAASLLNHSLTETQEKAIRKIHGAENSTEKGISKGVYENGHPELRAIVEELDKAGFSREEGRKLMENGVLGKISNIEALFGHSNRTSILHQGEILPVGGSSMGKTDFFLHIDRRPEIESMKNRIINDAELHARWEKIDLSFPSKIDSKLFSLLFLIENKIGPSILNTAEGLVKRESIYSKEKTVSLSRIIDEKIAACAESSVEAKLFLDQAAKEIPELS